MTVKIDRKGGAMKKLFSLKPVIYGLVTILMAAAFFNFGCGKKEKEIKIGVLMPLTGGQAKYGESVKHGIDLAIKERKNAGGIEGRAVTAVYEDYQGTPERAVSGIQKLITINKVKVIIGAFGSSATLAVAPIAEKNKVVLLSPSSSSPKITDAGDFIFRNEISEVYGAKRSAELYYEAGFTKVGILYINNDYGVGVKDITKQVYDSLKGTVTAAESFDEDATDFRTQLLKIEKSNSQTILIVGYKEMIQILKQIKELGIKRQLLSTPMFEDPEIIEKVRDLANGVIYTYYGTYFPESQLEIVRKFVTQFKSEYGIEPSYYAALAYDATKILIQAITKGGYDAIKIKNALYQIKDFPGVTGSTSFDQNGDVIKPVILKTVRSQKFVLYGK